MSWAIPMVAAVTAVLLAASPGAASQQRPIDRSRAAPTVDVSASDLRLTLGRLLGEHAYLAMEAMRAAATNRADADALLGGLDKNSTELTAAVASVYGADAGSEFERLWQQHIDALVAFARARAAGNQAAMDGARASMDNFRAAFSRFLADANPNLSGDAEAHALQLHLDQLTSFVEVDYRQAFATARAAYSHMFEFGDDLARAIAAQFPERFDGGNVAFSGRTTLRRDLGRLLGEHLVLAAEAMRAGLDGRPDAAAAASSLRANSADLASLIGNVYGSDAEAAFAELWGRHIETYLGYIGAVRSRNAAGRTAALRDLQVYHTAVAEFVHAAAPALSVRDVEALISHHVTALINQVDASAAGDHVRSVSVTREAYAHMFEVGDALGTAIADQFPERFPDLKDFPATSAIGAAEADHPGPPVGLSFLIGFVTFVILAVRGRPGRPT